MKTPSILAIATEALVTVSLIALLGLLTALIYALLSFLSAEPTTQSVLSQIPTDVTTVKTFTVTETLLPATTLTLSSAKDAPKLEVNGDQVVNGQKTTLRLKSLPTIDHRHYS